MYKFKNILLIGIFLIAIAAILGCSKPENAEQKVNFTNPFKGVYIVDINTKLCPDCISIYNSESLETVEEIAKRTGATAAINAGFFDPSNKLTTSYTVIDSVMVADPALNSNLVDNDKIKPYLPQIFNRSEFRILNCNGELKYSIKSHNQDTDNCTLLHSVQAGPQLFPSLKLEEEAFVVKRDGKVIKESAGALGKHARSAIGIKQDHILLIAVDNTNGMPISELATLMKKLNVEQAMAFDGGSSTSLYVNLLEQKLFNLVSAKDNSARRVKSVILVK